MTYTPCSREGCQVAATSKCLEGFEPPSTCPYLSSSAISAGDAASTDTSAFVDLPRGEALNEVQASEITRQGITRVIILAGATGSGKTTILTSLFESFLEAPFGNFIFAGSRTLVGFERRCHDARVASRRQDAHTVHTPVEPLEFLHLRLSPPLPSLLGPQSLLLSDISGERFRALRDSTDAVKNMPMLRRADSLCIILDGEKLSDVNQRQLARTDARMLLRSLIQGQALSQNCNIEIVFAKWDLLLGHPDQASLMSFVENTKEEMRKVSEKVTIPQFFEIAARPRSRNVPFAFGLPTLLRSWLKEPSDPARVTLYLPGMQKDDGEAIRFAKAVVEDQRLGEFYDVQWV